MPEKLDSGIVLLTGATGYVGGRLLRSLEKRGERVRCLTRHPETLRPRVGSRIEVISGDVLDEASLHAALEGSETAYYLVHSMGNSGSFEDLDRRAAENFSRAAKKAGIRRIVYLGGLAPRSEPLSPHLRSRVEVGKILRDSGIPTIEFRASIVIGSGSLSFEMIRALVERLPVMITPRWVQAPAQPIAIEDVTAYLVAALSLPAGENEIFEIGGADVVSYREIMREYARQRGLRRLMIRVPVLTPALSSLWLGLVTPLFARVGRKLIDSIRHATVVNDPSALQRFAIRPLGIREAIARALRNEDEEFAQTRWSDALSSGGEPEDWSRTRFGNRIVDTRSIFVHASTECAFRPVERIGGKNGWYAASLLWRIRAGIDLLIGGVGIRRGRPHPQILRVGDALDCWRVEAIEPGKRLRLRAEMKLPGRAWLEFEAAPEGSGTRLTQTAIFDPIGLGGILYWYLLLPAHAWIFRRMLREIAKRAG